MIFKELAIVLKEQLRFIYKTKAFKTIKEAEVFKVVGKDRDRFREIKGDSIFGMATSTTENNERAMGFVNFHRFTTRRAFWVREREDFVLGRMRKSERMIADFTKELLIAVFVVTVFVEVGRATLWARRCWVIHIGIPPLDKSCWGVSPI